MARPKKAIMSDAEHEIDVIDKLYDFTPEATGKVIAKRNNVQLTYEDAAYALWLKEGKKGKPLSKVGILKIEERALMKIRKELEKIGIHGIDDFLEPKYRNATTQYQATSNPE